MEGFLTVFIPAAIGGFFGPWIHNWFAKKYKAWKKRRALALASEVMGQGSVPYSNIKIPMPTCKPPKKS